MHTSGLFVAGLLLVTTSAAADVYRCPDGHGKTRYQNMPCDDAAPVLETRSPSVLAPRRVSEVDAPSVPSMLMPPPSPMMEAPARQAPPSPVDTRQFGMLSLGSSERNVLEKLGEPGEVVQDAQTFVRVRRPGGGVELREKRRYAWVYPGNNQIMDTILTFEDGELVHKVKRPW